jgi:hypothetical protein
LSVSCIFSFHSCCCCCSCSFYIPLLIHDWIEGKDWLKEKSLLAGS